MKPGRELDALIAKKVMGIKDVQMTVGFGPVYDFTGAQGMPRKVVPNYSTDIRAAWELVKKLAPSGYMVQIVQRGTNDYWVSVKDGEIIFAETAPHAICLAALKAVEAL